MFPLGRPEKLFSHPTVGRIFAASGAGLTGFAIGPLIGTMLAATIAPNAAGPDFIEVGRWGGMLVGAIAGACLGAFLVGRPIVAKACGQCALIVGGAAFLVGFIGPMLFAPHSPQGPLLGIFFTGPLGLIVGLIIGLILGLSRERRGGEARSNRSEIRST